MKKFTHVRTYLMVCMLLTVWLPVPGVAQQSSNPPEAALPRARPNTMANMTLTSRLALGKSTCRDSRIVWLVLRLGSNLMARR